MNRRSVAAALLTSTALCLTLANSALAQPMPAPAATSDHAWDVIAGGVNAGRWNFKTDLQLNLTPTVSVAYGLSNAIEFGLAASTGSSVAEWATPLLNGNIGAYITLPFRLSFVNSGRQSFGLRIAPGLAMYASPARGTMSYGVAVNAALNYGYWVVPRTFMLGLGFDAPMLIAVSAGAAFTAPMVFGPIAEYNFTDHFALFAEVKLGTTLDTRNNFYWAQRIAFGISGHL